MFVIVFNEVAQTNTLESIAHNILAELEPPIIFGTQEVFVSPSVGISVFPDDGQDTETLLRNANSAACAQMVAWRNAGLSDMRVAVNLSPRQFRQPDLLPLIRRILDEHGLPASNLEREITESSAMHDPRQRRRRSRN